MNHDSFLCKGATDAGRVRHDSTYAIQYVSFPRDMAHYDMTRPSWYDSSLRDMTHSRFDMSRFLVMDQVLDVGWCKGITDKGIRSPSPNLSPYIFFGSRPQPPTSLHRYPQKRVPRCPQKRAHRYPRVVQGNHWQRNQVCVMSHSDVTRRVLLRDMTHSYMKLLIPTYEWTYFHVTWLI